MRKLNRIARLLALLALAVGAGAFASGTPNQPDKKVEPKKTKNTSENWVYFGVHPCEFVCYPEDPYKLTVEYNAIEDGLEVAVTYAGGTLKKDAPKGTGELTFDLKYVYDTTDTDITIALRSQATPTDIKSTEPRYHLCFLTGGMGPPVAAPGTPKRTTTAITKGVKAGDPVPAGCHTGEFPAMKLFAGAQARFWVQGRFKNGPPKMEYDRPATVTWHQIAEGKYVPKWSALVGGPLKAEPSASGEVPRTFVLVALLNDQGRVVMVIPYIYWE